ncbi:hypothetical protein HDU98_007673 [Podochytrium sp. JEL0797]|nr:hypothetical protein HDU98_007673 [Podochytrium sp. JEL0797]
MRSLDMDVLNAIYNRMVFLENRVSKQNAELASLEFQLARLRGPRTEPLPPRKPIKTCNALQRTAQETDESAQTGVDLKSPKRLDSKLSEQLPYSLVPPMSPNTAYLQSLLTGVIAMAPEPPTQSDMRERDQASVTSSVVGNVPESNASETMILPNWGDWNLLPPPPPPVLAIQQSPQQSSTPPSLSARHTPHQSPPTSQYIPSQGLSSSHWMTPQESKMSREIRDASLHSDSVATAATPPLSRTGTPEPIKKRIVKVKGAVEIREKSTPARVGIEIRNKADGHEKRGSKECTIEGRKAIQPTCGIEIHEKQPPRVTDANVSSAGVDTRARMSEMSPPVSISSGEMRRKRYQDNEWVLKEFEPESKRARVGDALCVTYNVTGKCIGDRCNNGQHACYICGEAHSKLVCPNRHLHQSHCVYWYSIF